MREGPAKFVGPFFTGRSSNLGATYESLVVGAGRNDSRTRNSRTNDSRTEDLRTKDSRTEGKETCFDLKKFKLRLRKPCKARKTLQRLTKIRRSSRYICCRHSS